MKTDSLKRIEEIFHAALELPTDKRDVFIKKWCGEDKDLYRDVISMLSLGSETETFLDHSPESLVADMFAEKEISLDLTGTEIGHYKVVKLLGKGGMGVVYLAEDSKLDRLVALKILSPDFASNENRMDRFVGEAKSASALNHPNIITIHEIGDWEGTHFIATEFIDGKPLNELLHETKLDVRTVLDIAIQIASALDEAHRAGIVHRDIKPDNIMVRPNGLVKILDFGLAKLNDDMPGFAKKKVDSSDGVSKPRTPSARSHETQPGIIIGTPNYMSPEHARGRDADGRSDLFSLGSVIYEMLTDRLAFDGESPVDVLAAIIHKEPQPLQEIRSDVPADLSKIVHKLLSKERKGRYQNAHDLGLDLEEVRRNIQTQVVPGSQTGRHRSEIDTQVMRVMDTDAPNITAEYPAIRPRRRKWVAVAAIIPTIAIAVIAAVAYLTVFRQPSTLTDRDSILLADIENSTGDAVFDGALKQGLAINLGQSPFLDIFPESRVRQTLQLMQRAPDERVTESIAREICQRQGLKALITGSIAPLGSHYVIMLKAVNAQTGDEIAREQTEADGKEGVLTALSKAATQMRGKLGESLASIQKFDAPVEQATTGSLEALKSFSLGIEQANGGNYPKAIPYYQRAVEIDPGFALGYQALARDQLNSGFNDQAIISATKAYELRDRTSENEKFYITLIYHRVVTNDLEKGIEVGEQWKNTYPRFWRPYHSLADIYLDFGDFQKAVENGREASRLNPKVAATYSNYAGGLMFQGRFDEAEQVYKQGFDNGIDAPEWHWYLYWISFSRSDADGMKKQIDWLKNGNYGRWAAVIEGQTAAVGGKWKQSRQSMEQALDLFREKNMTGLVAWTSVRWAQTAAAFGDCKNAKLDAERTLQNSRDATYSGSIAVLAFCGDKTRFLAESKRLADAYPADTRFHGIWLPLGHAGADYQSGEYQKALDQLAPSSKFDAAGDFQLQYLRGLIYLKLNKPTEAAAEFQKIIDRRGQAEVLVSALYPLATLGLARSAVLAGDKEKARGLYDEFFQKWKDADADLPVLIEARKEYGALK